MSHQWPHGDLAKSGLPKKKAFGELLRVFQPGVGLPRLHDSPRLSKEASHHTGRVFSEEKQMMDSGLKVSKGNIQNKNSLVEWRGLEVRYL